MIGAFGHRSSRILFQNVSVSFAVSEIIVKMYGSEESI